MDVTPMYIVRRCDRSIFIFITITQDERRPTGELWAELTGEINSILIALHL